MQGLMMDTPLLISAIIRHAARNFPEREIVSVTSDNPEHRYSIRDCIPRVHKLANALDKLGLSAGVLAVRGYEDPMEEGDRLASTLRVVKVEGVAIGMVHDIQWPGPKIATSPDGTGLVYPSGNGREIMARKFKEPVDVVLFGDTHQELVTRWDGVLIMNPGSPTYPGRRHNQGALGTIGILEVDGEEATAKIVNLEPIK